MNSHNDPRFELPTHWTPEQALAVFEIIDLIRDRLWADYGDDIQRAIQEEQLGDVGDSPTTNHDDPPF
jgi:hypothetical protein